MALKKTFTVDEIWQLLYSNGAGKDPRSPIRIWDYENLIPNNKFINSLKPLGKGAFGSVYVINIEGLDYALKIMTQRRGETQQSLIDNFYNECRSLLSVNHNRVLRLIGVAIDTSTEDEFCFCHYTNYQQKGNLYDIIKNKQLLKDDPAGSLKRFQNKTKLLGQIAEGIHAIHAVGLIHRDLKAQNVFLDENDAPKVADLGLAGDDTKMSTSKARGTAQWMAPEVFEFRVSPASDIWALACIAIEIFNETLPYPQLKEMDKLKDYVCNQRQIPQFSQEILQDQLLAQLLYKCFNYDFNKRPNIQEFRKQLDIIKQKFDVQQNNNPAQQDSQNLSQFQSQNQSSQASTQSSSNQGTRTYQHMSVQQPKTDYVNKVIFLKNAQTIIYQKGQVYEQKILESSKINMDEGSSVYYTNQNIFVSGGYSPSCQKSFQIIDRNSLQVVKACEMLNPRNGHGMLLFNTKDNTYILIVSGNQTAQKDIKDCEAYDFSQGKIIPFYPIIFSGRNQGCIQHKQNIIVLGGESTEFTKICLGQWFDQELKIWRIIPKCLPIGSSVSLVRSEDEDIYMFGDFLKGVYQFKFDEDDPNFLQISDKPYPGRSCNQNPIIKENEILVFDGIQLNSFDLKKNQWNSYSIQ